MLGPITVPQTLQDMNQLLLSLFEEMDREALPVETDYPTGLWWYVGHLDRNKPEFRKLANTEVAWSHRLQEMLSEHGFDASAECRYPQGSKQRCDTVVNFDKGRHFWIEVKGSWRAVFDPGRNNSAFQKHLYAAADDIDKLMTLRKEVADGTSFVLIGFDQEDLPITEEHLEIIREKTRNENWVEDSAQWTIKGRVTFRTRIWVWSRWTQETAPRERAR